MKPCGAFLVSFENGECVDVGDQVAVEDGGAAGKDGGGHDHDDAGIEVEEWQELHTVGAEAESE